MTLLAPGAEDHARVAAVWEDMRARTDWAPDAEGPRDPNRPLRRIFVVGGYAVEPDRLCLRDEFWLAAAFQFFQREGIELAAHVEIFAPNLVNQEDVLDPAFRASLGMRPDILLIAAVPTSAFARALREGGCDENAALVSPHDRPGAWRAAADALGAQLILTFGREPEAVEGDAHKEIDARDFVQADDKRYAFGGRYGARAPAKSMHWDDGVAFQLEVVYRRDCRALTRLGG